MVKSLNLNPVGEYAGCDKWLCSLLFWLGQAGVLGFFVFAYVQASWASHENAVIDWQRHIPPEEPFNINSRSRSASVSSLTEHAEPPLASLKVTFLDGRGDREGNIGRLRIFP